jgi:hypothetical protein
MREFFVIASVVVATVATVLAWLYRGLLMSLAVRLLAASLPDAARRRGLQISFGSHQGGWIRFTLRADLGKALSEVLGRPVEGAALSRFGGFSLSHIYSDFMNPDSTYYQAWLGAYVVFDDKDRRAFGFRDQGDYVSEEALVVLEADQRLVFRSAGCPHEFPDGNVVRLRDELAAEQLELDGLSWWRITGEAETWSAYHRGTVPEASGLRSRIYGVVPSSAKHDVDDFHPLRYRGEFWMRYFPEYEATCAKFYIYPCYIDRYGGEVTKGEHLVAECRELLATITFSRQ